MSYRVATLDLKSFRNYDTHHLDTFGALNILVGENGIGKTNILEAIYLTSALGSFRSSNPRELIRWADERACVTLGLTDGEHAREIVCEIEGSRKGYRFNGKAISRQSLLGTVPAIIFSPDDLRLVKEGATRKRKAIDELGCQLSRNYRAVKHDYDKIIRQKNTLLKERVSPTYLESVNDTLARVGTQLYLYRQRIVKDLSTLLQTSYRTMIGKNEDIELVYEPSWDRLTDESMAQISSAELSSDARWGDTKGSHERRSSPHYRNDGGDLNNTSNDKNGKASLDSNTPTILDRHEEDQLNPVNKESKEHILALFSEALSRMTHEELIHHRALVGPHRDRPAFLINGKDASIYGSQGQQRSIALAFKLVELSYLRERLETQPLLLLDDVMSELDEIRRETLMGFIPDDVQTFITTTHLDYFNHDTLDHAVIISL